jgi:hypothetical protein
MTNVQSQSSPRETRSRSSEKDAADRGERRVDDLSFPQDPRLSGSAVRISVFGSVSSSNSESSVTVFA